LILPQRIQQKLRLNEKQDPIADANTDRESNESGTFNKLTDLRLLRLGFTQHKD